MRSQEKDKPARSLTRKKRQTRLTNEPASVTDSSSIGNLNLWLSHHRLRSGLRNTRAVQENWRIGNRHLQKVVAISPPNTNQVQRVTIEGELEEVEAETNSGDLEGIVEDVIDELAEKALPGYGLAKKTIEISGIIILDFCIDLRRYTNNIRRRERPSTVVAWSREWLLRGTRRLRVVPAIVLESVPESIKRIVIDELEDWALDKLVLC